MQHEGDPIVDDGLDEPAPVYRRVDGETASVEVTYKFLSIEGKKTLVKTMMTMVKMTLS